MTAEEEAVFAEHFTHLERLLAQGVLLLAGPTLGETNTGITVIEAPDAASAWALMDADPVVAHGIARGQLREMRVSLMRGAAECR